jgi:hypothetical protein
MRLLFLDAGQRLIRPPPTPSPGPHTYTQANTHKLAAGAHLALPLPVQAVISEAENGARRPAPLCHPPPPPWGYRSCQRHARYEGVDEPACREEQHPGGL